MKQSGYHPGMDTKKHLSQLPLEVASLTTSQKAWIHAFVQQFKMPHTFTRNSSSDLVTDLVLENIGDLLRMARPRPEVRALNYGEKTVAATNLLNVIKSGDADKNLNQVDLKGPVALVLGAEGDGMRQLTRKTCDELVSIPMHGAVESLNVSVASGVCLYEALRQRRPA